VQLYCRWSCVFFVDVHTTCFGLHGHLQECMIFYFLFLKESASLLLLPFLARGYTMHVLICVFSVVFSLISIFLCACLVFLPFLVVFSGLCKTSYVLGKGESTWFWRLEYVRINDIVLQVCRTVTRNDKHTASQNTTFIRDNRHRFAIHNSKMPFMAQMNINPKCSERTQELYEPKFTWTKISFYDINIS
jgi:hypothetical protein